MTLRETLINSGTGVISGYFRMPVGLISFENYKDIMNTKKELDSGIPSLLPDKEQIERDFEKIISRLGKNLHLYEKMLTNPVIRLSGPLGEPMGIWNITDIHDPGSGESEGQYVITATSDEMEIEIDTEMIDLSGDYGTCQIKIMSPEKYFSFWDE